MRYSLAPGARLEVRAGDSWLVSDRPLIAWRLNASAAELLGRVLDSPGAAGLQSQEESFLQGLVDQGWLEMLLDPLVAPLPKVSVVVPVRNRPHEIETCLATLLEVDYPRDRLEIIVVDDGSTDETPDVVRRFPVRLVVADKWQGASACRNLGARHASGEIIAFTDSDCRVSPSWLKELLPYLYLPRCAAVGGRVLPASETTLMDRYAATHSALDMGERTRRVAPGSLVFYVPSCNLLVWREAMLRTGGYDRDFPIGEDIDLEYRLMEQGGVVWYAACGVVYHAHRTQLRKRWLRLLDYSASEGYLQRRHAALRKKWPVPASFPVVVGIVLAAALTGRPAILLAVPALLALQVGQKALQSRPLRVPVSPGRLLVSVLYGYWTQLHFASWLIVRYYLLFAVVLAIFWPPLWLAIGLALLIAPVGEFVRTRPHVGLAAFIPLYLLDCLAYHAGILSAVVRQRTLWPIRTGVKLQTPNLPASLGLPGRWKFGGTS